MVDWSTLSPGHRRPLVVPRNGGGGCDDGGGEGGGNWVEMSPSSGPSTTLQ